MEWNEMEAKTGAELEGDLWTRGGREGREIYHRWLCQRQRAKQKCSSRRPLWSSMYDILPERGGSRNEAKVRTYTTGPEPMMPCRKWSRGQH